MSRVTAIFYCPFCAEEDLRASAGADRAWSCGACARVFRVSLESR